MQERIDALVAEADLDLAVANLFHRVVDLVGHLAEEMRVVLEFLPRAARDPTRPVALEQQAPRVRSGDVEDVEVREELGADRPERGDGAVEQHEPRRQP